MADFFTEAPDEVTRYFDAKTSKPTFSWLDVAPYESAVGFTVAKSAGYDVLDDIRVATDAAVRNYGDYGSFVDQLEPLLKAKGWWGRADVFDPVTGEKVNAQLGSLHRLRIIYWANTSTARAAGEWERIQRTKDGLPFLVYGQSRAENKRPEHQAWVGTILPVDDPWWRTHYPPNAWLCQCRATQTSRYDAIKKGYDPATPAPKIEMKRWTNKRTGESYDVPKGIDPGWQTNPGMQRASGVQALLAGKLGLLSEPQRKAAMRDVVGSRLFRAIQANEFGYDISRVGEAFQREIGRIATPIAAIPADVAQLMDVDLSVLHFSVGDAAKQLAKPERQGFDARTYTIVQTLLTDGDLFSDNGKGPRNFVALAVIDGVQWFAALQVSGDKRFVFLKSFRRAELGITKPNRWERLK